MSKNNQVYLDPRGKRYTVESSACASGLGGITKVFRILYEDGSRAVFPESIHLQHSKLEQDAQSSTKCTEEQEARRKRILDFEKQSYQSAQKAFDSIK